MKNKRNNNVEEKTHATGKSLTSEQDKAISLVKRAIGGDFAAFGYLYGIYLDRIYRYVFYKVKDKMTAEDITEEVFLKAWKAINSCKGKERTFSSWLYRIAHNHIIDIFRTRMTGRHHQVALVLAVLIIHQDYHATGTDILDNFFSTV